MYISNPDFEAMKDITRLFWLLDANPCAAPLLPKAAAGKPLHEDRA